MAQELLVLAYVSSVVCIRMGGYWPLSLPPIYRLSHLITGYDEKNPLVAFCHSSTFTLCSSGCWFHRVLPAGCFHFFTFIGDVAAAVWQASRKSTRQWESEISICWWNPRKNSSDITPIEFGKRCSHSPYKNLCVFTYEEEVCPYKRRRSKCGS